MRPRSFRCTPLVRHGRPWIMRPWTVRVSPIGAFAAAAALVGVVAMGAWRLSSIDQVQVANSQFGDSNLVPVANVGDEPLVLPPVHVLPEGAQVDLARRPVQ